mgnify:FL=1
MNDDEQAIRQVIDNFLRSYERQDADGCLTHMSSEKPFMFFGTNTNEVFTSPKELRPVFAKDFRTMDNLK